MADADSTRPRSPSVSRPSEIERQITALASMSLPELQDRYAEVFGEATKNHHKVHLRRKIAWRIQMLAEGGLSERALKRAAELARDADVRIRAPKSFDPDRSMGVASETPPDPDPRLPSVGTALVRLYKGNKLQVTVLANGFEYDGERFRSLSAVAKAITGSHCNGFRFFGLKETP